MSDLATLYTVIGTIVVAVIGYAGLHRQTKKPAKDTVRTTTGEVFTGSPNEGISIALREIGRLSGEVERLGTEVATLTTWRSTFTGAIKRYLAKIARAWTHDDPMPQPDDDDLLILGSILPTQNDTTA